MPKASHITVVLDDIRSTYNVGAIMRTLDAIGGGTIVCCGLTPYPDLGDGDDRSPVVRTANTKAIAKTALGAEQALALEHADSVLEAVEQLKRNGVLIYALEQSPRSQNLMTFDVPRDSVFALVVGSEVEGVCPAVLSACDQVLEIPQNGTKESLNVSVAAGIALYKLSGPTAGRSSAVSRRLFSF
jgi:tRNA G18 (ribose-2'-O)-methylase SpoU